MTIENVLLESLNNQNLYLPTLNTRRGETINLLDLKSNQDTIYIFDTSFIGQYFNYLQELELDEIEPFTNQVQTIMHMLNDSKNALLTLGTLKSLRSGAINLNRNINEQTIHEDDSRMLETKSLLKDFCKKIMKEGITKKPDKVLRKNEYCFNLNQSQFNELKNEFCDSNNCTKTYSKYSNKGFVPIQKNVNISTINTHIEATMINDILQKEGRNAILVTQSTSALLEGLVGDLIPHRIYFNTVTDRKEDLGTKLQEYRINT
jgi:hypothetical protein